MLMIVNNLIGQVEDNMRHFSFYYHKKGAEFRDPINTFFQIDLVEKYFSQLRAKTEAKVDFNERCHIN